MLPRRRVDTQSNWKDTTHKENQAELRQRKEHLRSIVDGTAILNDGVKLTGPPSEKTQRGRRSSKWIKDLNRKRKRKTRLLVKLSEENMEEFIYHLFGGRFFFNYHSESKSVK